MKTDVCRDGVDEKDVEEVMRRRQERQPVKVETLWETDDEGFGEPLEGASEPDTPPGQSSTPLEHLLSLRLARLHCKRDTAQRRLARHLYKENRRINRQLKLEAYRRWFRHVFLGNLARWTWWTD